MGMNGYSSSGAGQRTADEVEKAAHRIHAVRGECSRGMDRTRGAVDQTSGRREEWRLAGCAPPHAIKLSDLEAIQGSFRPTQRPHWTRTPATRSGKSTETRQHWRLSNSDSHPAARRTVEPRLYVSDR